MKKSLQTTLVLAALALTSLAFAQDGPPEAGGDGAEGTLVPPTSEQKAKVKEVMKDTKSERRTKLQEMRTRHMAARNAMMTEMMGKIKAATTKEEKKRIHDEYQPKIKEQNEQFRAEAMAVRGDSEAEIAALREEAKAKFKANKAEAKDEGKSPKK